MVFERAFGLTARRRFCAALAALLALPLATSPAPAQSRCGVGTLDAIPDRIRALEAQRPSTADEALRRARDLAAVLADPALGGVLAQPCPGDNSEAVLRTLARQRLLILWTKMVALEAVDEPVYPAPYDRRCAGIDGATWQLAFIRAYVERLDPQGTEATRPALRLALDRDPLAGHVRDTVAARAARLRIGALPGADSDEAAWLANNELARSKALAALSPGIRCGAIAGISP